MKRTLEVFVAICLSALLFVPTARADTTVSSSISSNTTWTVAGSPYIVTANVSISSSATLTIDPGVTVRFAAAKYLDVYGKLLANGTAANRIVFTSSAATPTRGAWGCIYFEPGTNPSASQIAYADILYSGASYGGAVVLSGSSPTFSNVTISESSTHGVYATGAASSSLSAFTVSNNTSSGIRAENGTGTLSVTGSTLSSNGVHGLDLGASGGVSITDTAINSNTNYAIGANPGARLLGGSGVTATGNGSGAKNAIGLRAGSTATSETWRKFPNLDWIVTGNVSVASSSVLTIEPAVTVKFDSAKYLDVYGKLMAEGAASNRIVFTSSAATPARGAWGCIYFEPGANPSASVVSYADILYSGSSYGGAVVLSGSSPTFNNVSISESSTHGIFATGAASSSFTAVTISNNTSSGIRAENGTGTLTVNGSTLSSNGVHGVDLGPAGGVSLTDTAITSNGSYAIGANTATRLLGGTGISATSSGGGAKNGIGLRAGSVAAAETWKKFPALDWFVTGDITVGSGSVLTVEPGVTVKFDSAKYLDVYGKLLAQGTSANRITFTSSAAAPARGAWGCIYFEAGANPSASLVSYSDILYSGGSYGGAVVISGSSPKISQSTISESSTLAVKFTTSAGIIEHSRVFNNTLGISNTTPATVASARFLDWGSPTGPSGSGPGSGAAVSSGILFEPWLAAAQSAPQSFTALTIQNQTFNPDAAVSANYDFGSALSGSWTAKIYNGTGTLQRTFTGSGLTGQISWDGKNEAGGILPSGVYTVRLDSTATEGTATQIRARAIIDSTFQLTLTGFAISQRYISPNADTIQETTTASANTNDATSTWTAEVKNSSGTVINSGTGTGASYSYLWDGKTSGAVVAPDGDYNIHLIVQKGGGQVTASGPVTLDTTVPVAVISSPANGATVSNVRQNGSTNAPVVGTVSDTNFLSWSLQDGAGASPSTWSAVASGSTPVSASTLGSWNTLVRPNGTHSLKLTANDKAGNQTVTTVSPSVANFSMSQAELELNPSLGQLINYTSIVPFTLAQSIVIKNTAGQTVRTVLSGQSRAAGTYNDSWDGRDDQGTILPDGTYFYFAPVVEGTSSMTWDEGGASRAGFDTYKSYYTYPAWDPWMNQPLVFSYDFEKAGKIRIIIGKADHLTTFPDMQNNCDPPHVCFVDYAYQDSGPHTFIWNGVDPDGIVRRDVDAATVIITHAGFAKNAAVLYGSVRTAISNLFINSTLFSPAFQTQSIEFDLVTFRNLPVTLTVKFVNQESKSVLRTISGTYNPGHIQIVWDGRADNGMWVAPGEYGLTVKAEDSNGEVARSQGLFAVQY